MTTTDWIIDLTLILIVLRQVRESRLDAMFFVVPLALVSWSGAHYLHGVPNAGHDVAFTFLLAGAGALLGLVSGALTRVRVHGGHVLVRAGAAAASLWVLGTGTRLAFQLFATHGGGAEVTRFSIHHQITGSSTWTTGLVLMALSEVIARMTVIGVRGALRSRSGGVVTAALPASSVA